MSHPDPNGEPASRPWQVGDEMTNPVTNEHARLRMVAWANPEGRARAEEARAAAATLADDAP